MKILIVEDEPKTGEYLRQGLREAGGYFWTCSPAESLACTKRWKLTTTWSCWT